jgi:hypothetical protein
MNLDQLKNTINIEQITMELNWEAPLSSNGLEAI